MAKFSNVNVVATDPTDVMFNLMNTLISAGWTHVASSDGTTFSTASNQITAASDLNNNAFFVLEDPGGHRQFAWQRGSLANWLVLYSALDGFSSGGDATTVPTATDEVEIRGNGSRGAAALFSDTSDLKTHCVAESTPIGDVYPFWFGSWSNGTTASSGGMVCEAMQVGTYPNEPTPSAPTVGDADPCVIVADNGATWTVIGSGTDNIGSSVSQWKSWYRYNYPEQKFVTLSGYPFGSSAEVFNKLGTNPYVAGAVDILPFFWCRPTSDWQDAAGAKGVGGWCRCPGVDGVQPDTVNLATDAYFYWNDLLLP